MVCLSFPFIQNSVQAHTVTVDKRKELLDPHTAIAQLHVLFPIPLRRARRFFLQSHELIAGELNCVSSKEAL